MQFTRSFSCPISMLSLLIYSWQPSSFFNSAIFYFSLPIDFCLEIERYVIELILNIWFMKILQYHNIERSSLFQKQIQHSLFLYIIYIFSEDFFINLKYLFNSFSKNTFVFEKKLRKQVSKHETKLIFRMKTIMQN